MIELLVRASDIYKKTLRWYQLIKQSIDGWQRASKVEIVLLHERIDVDHQLSKPFCLLCGGKGVVMSSGVRKLQHCAIEWWPCM